MKKFFTSLKAFATVAMLAVAGNVMAGSDYYAYYVQVNATPEGKGTIYATETYSSEVPTDDQYTDKVELQFTSTSGAVYIYAKPAEGYQFAGVSAATFSEAGEPIYSEEEITAPGSEYTSVFPSSNIVGEDEADVAAQMPLDPNNVYYALFTRVVAKPANDQMKRLGYTTVSDPTNDNGDKITLTATPNYDETSKFAYWVKESTGEKITENPLTITVDGKETYLAYFDSDLRVDVDFGDETSYKVWYNDRASFLGDVKTIYFGMNGTYATYMYDKISEEDNLRYTYFDTNEAGYSTYGKQAYILKGKGVMTIILDKEEAASANDAILQYAQVATTVAELPVSAKYYNVNIEERTLTLMADDAAIAEGTLYAAVPVSYFLEGYYEPATIYWSEEEAKGQDPVTGICNIVTSAPANAAIFTLDGKKVDKVSKPGVYVLNGKAVIMK